MLTSQDTSWIVGRSRTTGFDLCGIVRPDRFPELAHLDEWLARGYAGEMHYLEDSRRGDPRNARPGVRSAIVCALNYNTPYPYSTKAVEELNSCERGSPRGWISRYAWGGDYHETLWSMLNRLVEDLRTRFGPDFEAYACADTGPVHERALARHAGLGWIGKNTLLLNQQIGSWFFLGVILTSLDLEPSLAAEQTLPADLCGSCRKCIDACPTQAFVAPYVMDARRCISYLTIELKDSIPEEFREGIGWQVFGCDICQDVCPWNRKAPSSSVSPFQPRLIGDENTKSLLAPELEWLAGLTIEEFRTAFRGSPVKRTKWRGLVRNACIALGNGRLQPDSAHAKRVVALLERLAGNEDSLIAESAQWALSRIQQSRPGAGSLPAASASRIS